IVTGIFSLVLPLVWPGYFFPLVWVAFVFLLEPVNHKAGAPSLLREWEKGSLRRSYLLLLAGAFAVFCGSYGTSGPGRNGYTPCLTSAS
ncbi:MAG: hypothetical protein ACLQDI_02665, partial [Syntrophobacteraceae bacterium]